MATKMKRSAAPKGAGRKILSFTAGFLLWLVLLAMTGWGILAVYYSNLPAGIRPFAAGLFGVAALGILLFVRPRLRGRVIFLVLFALLVTWWLRMPPSNDRDWQPDLATLAWAEIAGDKVTIHNIRNCDYRTETDFTCHYYDKTFDLAKLKGVDFYPGLLGIAEYRPHHDELRLRGPGQRLLLHRDPQGKGRGVLHGQGLLPPV